MKEIQYIEENPMEKLENFNKLSKLLIKTYDSFL
jgi:hypothetical protein